MKIAGGSLGSSTDDFMIPASEPEGKCDVEEAVTFR
jgi:hypothetical protein